MTREEKTAAIEELKEKFSNSSYFYIADSSAMTVAQVNVLRRKLHEQVYDYLVDIFEGEDRPYAAQLLNRKAPLSQRLRYHWLRLASHINGFKNRFAFEDAMPLKLA